MKFSKAVLGLIFSLLAVLLECALGQERLWCVIEDVRDPGMPMPTLPVSYSSNIQLNFDTDHTTWDVTRIVDNKLNKSAIEIFAGNRHVKYIALPKDNSFLTIDYKENGASCSKKTLDKKSFRELYSEKDKVIAGALLGLERVISTNGAKTIFTGPTHIKGIYVQEWETCVSLSEINDAVDAKISFADSSWSPSHIQYPTAVPDSSNVGELVEIEMKIPGKLLDSTDYTEIVMADFSRFLPFTPADDEFQPPEEVHCPDFRIEVKPPSLPNYFRYNAEVIMHTDTTDVAPVVAHRTVYYDYTAGLTRIDLQDPLADNTAPTAFLGALVVSIIRDFKAGIEYVIDPSSGSCEINPVKDTSDVLSATALSTALMLDPTKFFHLDGGKMSYIGQYSARGLKTNMFSSVVKINEKDSRVFRWYFTTDKVQLIEDQQIEKNVLVKLVSKSQTSVGKSGEMEINFYNFVEEEPSILLYDVTSCYNETLSKTFILSFPGEMNMFMQESTVSLKQKIQRALREIANVTELRISVQEVTFRSSYLYAQFKIVDRLFESQSSETQSTLVEAVKKIQNAVSEGRLEINVPTKDNIIISLKPDPFGLKEYSKEEEPPVVHQGFSQGSVGGLAFGMILLGFLMGGAVVNLIISRKHGVSLFQKAGFGNSETSFNNPLNESPM